MRVRTMCSRRALASPYGTVGSSTEASFVTIVDGSGAGPNTSKTKIISQVAVLRTGPGGEGVVVADGAGHAAGRRRRRFLGDLLHRWDVRHLVPGEPVPGSVRRDAELQVRTTGGTA